MCLALFAYRTHPGLRLAVAANRDEFHARPTSKASFWKERPDILAGRDRVGGGTWLGVTRSGRIAFVTNYRALHEAHPGRVSRGLLVSGFLESDVTPESFAARIQDGLGEYGGFSLVLGDAEALWYVSNRDAAGPRPLAPGIYGLSNHLLDTPWPKVCVGKTRLAEALADWPGRLPAPSVSSRLIDRVLSDRTVPARDSLPDTGAGPDLEPLLAPIRVSIPSLRYGTRSSTAVLAAEDGGISFTERTFRPSGRRIFSIP